MATQYKLIVKENVTAATSTVALTASAANTVVASVTGTDSGGAANVEVLVKKAGGGIIELAYQAITTTSPTELLTAPVALEASDVLYVRTSRTGTNFIISYVEDTEAVAGQSIDVLSDVDTTGVVDGNALVYNSTSGNWEPGAGGGGASAMNDLTDVNSAAASQGSVLSYNSGSSTWIVDSFLQDVKDTYDKAASTTAIYNTLSDTTKGYMNLRSDGADLKKNKTGMSFSENSPGIVDFLVQDDGGAPAEITAMRITNGAGNSNDPQVIVGGTTAVAGNALTVIGDADFSADVQIDGDVTVTGALNATISTQNISDINPSAPASGEIMKYVGGEWTNAADSASFQKVAVSGQTTVVANDNKGILTLAAGSGTVITTDAGTDTVTISHTNPDIDDLNDVTITTPATGQHLEWNGTAWVNATPSGGGTDTNIANTNLTLDASRNLGLDGNTLTVDLEDGGEFFVNDTIAPDTHIEVSNGTVKLSGIEYPTSDGTANQVLKTNGAGALSFVTPTDTNTNLANTNLTQSGNKAYSIDGNELAFDLGSGDFVVKDGVTNRIYADGFGEVQLNSLTYPSTDGTNGQVLTTNGSGTLSFTTVSGGGGGGGGGASLSSADQTLTADRTIDTNGFNLDIELDGTGTADTFTIHDGTNDLFEVNTNTSGELFSVNDVSGLTTFASNDDGSAVLPKILTAAPTGTPPEGTMQLAIVSGTAYLYVYINAAWRKTTLA